MSRLNPNLPESERPYKKAKITNTRPNQPNPTRFNFVDPRQVSKQIKPTTTPMEIDTKEEQQEDNVMPRGLHV